MQYADAGLDTNPVDFVTSWDDFVKVFLKKFYLIYKIALIRKNIMQFKHDSNELFWR